jgi:hypothetical protein
VELSSGITSLNRIRANYLSGEIRPPALYLLSSLPDGTKVLDILAYQQKALVNLTLEPDSALSRELFPSNMAIDLTDINGDEILELPTSYLLPTKPYVLTDWAQYTQQGERNQVLTTYHNVNDNTADGWYFVIPENWKDKITVSRNDQISGQREVVFSLWLGADQEPVPFLSIYRLTGSNRAARSTRGERFVLREDSSVIYSAALHECQWDCGLDKLGVMEHFYTIQNSWISD